MNNLVRKIRNFVWANRRYRQLCDKVKKETGDRKWKALLKAVKFGDKYDIDPS